MKVLLPLSLLSLASVGSASDLALPAKIEFNRDIRPIMSDTCFHCHGFDPKTREAGLRLDVREDAVQATEDGVVGIVPGDPAKSEIIARIFDDEDPMPPEKAHKPLTARQKELFRRWVAEGAVYEPHWAYAPLEKPAPPAKEKHPIDAFIHAKLAEKGIKPSTLAPMHLLQRRLALDLTGLPPAPGTAATTIERQIEALLASPHFGERMAVWWLDIARYADTVGFHGDQNQRIFPYRDYVISAFNQNKRFDQFTREQLAGDLLPDATTEQRVATGYNRLNMMTREGGAQAREYLAKYGAERVRSVAAAWFGSTFGCAECHDHKFDPIKTRDFYELQSFFADVKQYGVYSSYGSSPDPELQGFTNDFPFPPEIQVESHALKKQAQRAEKAVTDHLTATWGKLARDPKIQQARSAWMAQMKPFVKTHPDGWQNAKVISANLIQPPKPAPAVKPVAKGKKPAEPVHATNKPVAAVAKAKKPASAELKVTPPKPIVTSAGAFRPEKALATGESLIVTIDTAKLPALAALRLQLDPTGLTPEQLSAGLGRTLSVTLTLRDAKGKTRKLGIRMADASAKQPSYRNGAEIIGIQGGWRLPQTLPEKAELTSIWLLDYPVPIQVGDRLILTLTGNNSLPFRASLSPMGRLDPLTIGAQKMDLSDPALFLLSTVHDRASYDTAVQLTARAREYHQGRAWTLVTQAVAKPLTVRVLPRGNWQDETGPVVLPATPSFLPGRIESTETKRLNRLDLANWITSADNPITARAVMNRLWALFFGTGLSAVVDDLGSQGELPSHPELLDWLACEFRESGWDMKHMVRLIVTSHTYQQSSSLRSELREIDPANRLLASQNPRRLEAEFIRDNALHVAGLLNLEDIGGPSVKPYQPADYYSALQFPDRDYITDTDDRQWRRGLYTHWQRTFLHPMMANFDAPARDECAAARVPSNTPQQALTLLNDPTFVEAARVFAARLLHSPTSKTDADRITQATRMVFNRAPKVKELENLTRFLAEQRQQYAATPEEAAKLIRIGIAPAAARDPVEHAAWTQLARVLLNTQETLCRY